jgi:hypothetical protein
MMTAGPFPNATTRHPGSRDAVEAIRDLLQVSHCRRSRMAVAKAPASGMTGGWGRR